MKQRYYALDVFRGATVALMILVNNPGTEQYVFSPLEHSEWNGVTPTDLVFPFFLFAVGNALAFVLPRLETAGAAVFWKKVIKRTILIYLTGLFITWFPFVQWMNNELVVKGWTWHSSTGELLGVRILGVLPRIALCYFFASVIAFYAKPKGAFLIGMILLLLYWALCLMGNPADPYSMTGWFGTRIDKLILHEPHMYHGEVLNGQPYVFDPEGIMSTLPAIVQVLFGFLVGDYLNKRGKLLSGNAPISKEANPFFETLTILFMAATALLFTGYIWNLSFPINKKIWTSSYVAFTTGLALLVLASLIYFIEVKKVRGWWTRFFDVFGKNALFIYALSILIPKTLFLIRIPNETNAAGQTVYINPWSWFYLNVWRHVPGPPEFGSLFFALFIILLLWAIAYWMDKRRIYVKI